jgi:hypothetical protein
MNPLRRVQDILLKPKDTWPQIAAESATPGSIYGGYLVFLAAVPAIAGFIGLSLIGVGGFGMSFRVPIASGLVHMVLSFVLSLVAVFVLALITDALAPSFGGTRSPINALKVVAYGSTAGFVGGVFSLLPALSVLGLLAGLYSIYLLYTGLPVLMRCPPEKAAAYTAVVVVCGIVAMVVLGALSALVLPGGLGGGRMMGDAGSVSIRTPGGEVKVDGNRMEQAAKALEEAGRRLEEAQKTGDAQAAGKAMGEVMGAVGGAIGGAAGAAGVNAKPIEAAALKALLPESLGALKRESIEAQSGQAMGMGGSSARAVYAAGNQRVELSVTDLGGLGALAAVAGWANMTVDRETAGETEKVYKQGDRTVRELFRKDGSRGEVTVILPGGVIVEADGNGVDAATLKSIAGGLDLARIEALKRAAK